MAFVMNKEKRVKLLEYSLPPVCLFVVCLFFFEINFFLKFLSGIPLECHFFFVGPGLGPNCLQRLSAGRRVMFVKYFSINKYGFVSVRWELIHPCCDLVD